jgi:RHS repeat-associated protein
MLTPRDLSLQWAYDRLGNRLSQKLIGGNVSIGQPIFTINETTNRINGFSYDLAGNMTGDTAFTYVYDGANRMTQAQQIGASGTTTVGAYFGALRVKKVVGTTATVYIYSGSGPIAEYVNGSTTPSKEYIYAGAQQLATIAGTTITYHHPDHLSNRAETDATGASVRSFGHFPYGEVWYESAPDQWKFTSYSRDSGSGETGLDYAVARFSSSGLARFMSPDPLSGNIAAPQSMNRYAYVTNDPVNQIDPLGLAGGNWKCRLLDTGDCEGGDYVGLNATAGMGLWEDPFGEWVDPTKWDPLAEGERAYLKNMYADLYQAQGGGEGGQPLTDEETPNTIVPDITIIVNCNSDGGVGWDCTADVSSLDHFADPFYRVHVGDRPAGPMANGIFQGQRSRWQQSAKTGEVLFAATVAIPSILIGAAEGPVVAINGATYIYYVLPATPFVADRILDWAYRMGTPGLFGAAWRFGKHEFTDH